MRKLLLVALVVFLLFPMSVAALGNVSNVSVEGSIYGPAFSIETHMDPSPPGWGLTMGENSWFVPPGTFPPPLPINQGPPMGLTITAHAQKDVAFSVSASDALPFGKPSGAKGKMAEWNITYNFTDMPPPLGTFTCVVGGPLVPGNCSLLRNSWETSGKILTRPLILNETVCAVPPCVPPFVFKNYNMTVADPVLFTGIGDTLPPIVPGGPPVLGLGTSRNYDVRQFITLGDTALRYDFPMPLPPPSPAFGIVKQNSYKMPITFTLTTL